MGALAGSWSPFSSGAQDDSSPQRIVFFIQPHGHVPNAWRMPVEGPTDRFAERSLLALSESELSTVLRPLHAFRDRLLVVEGLSHTSIQADIRQAKKLGQDINNHNVSISGLLTCDHALQRTGQPCTGGSRSLDQVLAERLADPSRFASRVYGRQYFVNGGYFPFSFLDAGKPTPIVQSPATAFADLMGRVSGGTMQQPSRAERLRALRGSVLDSVADEYATLAPKLGREGRAQLEAHRALVRDLELSLAAGVTAECDLGDDRSGDDFTQFMRLIRMAFACDLTRVVTYVAEVPECPAFGYPADANVHSSYAHGSVDGATSCGQRYTPLAEQAMTDLGVWYAQHFATLLKELDAVQEGSGTLLDHTIVVWLSELGTPTHQHHDAFSLIAGGTRAFRGGRYVRYPRTLSNPLVNEPAIGPAHSRLMVSLLRAMGQEDDSFGMAETTGADDSVLSLRGRLTELHR
jgi:hypothetical protein